MKKSLKKYRFHNLLKEQKVGFAIVAFLSIMFQTLFLSSIIAYKTNKEFSNARYFGEGISTSISLFLSQSIYSTKVVKNLYLQYGKQTFNNFGEMCKKFMEDDPTISSMYIAPDGIIQVAYPPEVETAYIGFRMLEDPEQGVKAHLAKDTRRITVAGPHNLVEGGTGLIIRNPIYNNDDFLGFSIAVINWNAYVENILNRLENKDAIYNFGVWKSDNSHTVVDDYGFIFKNCSGDVSKRVDIPIEIPNDEWHLSVEPISGWMDLKDVVAEIVITCLFVIFLLTLIFIHLCDSNYKLNSLKYDSLTGLYTRMSLYEKIRQLSKDNPDCQYDLLVADIENFKVVNSIYGAEECDKLLKYLAKVYERENSYATVARYGGDQFMILFPSSTNVGIEYFERRAKEVLEFAPIKNINIKYGFYGHIDLSLPPNLICDRAHSAARSILHKYNKIVASYDGPISKQNIKEHMLESSFRSAIENEEFKVWYQPKFDAQTEKIIGSEALVRWIHKDGSIVPPSEFIHIFEEDGLIVNLDEYVFRKVCSTLKKLQDENTMLYPVSVNLSRATLSRSDTIEKYANIVKEYGIPIEYVPLEITETTKTRDYEIKGFTDELKQYGFKIHMDDFGSGLSSLESLNILPFDIVKLDKSLIDFIGSPDGNELLRHCIELAHYKKLKVVAEGVENKDQLEFLRSLNCDYIQGYYYSAPMSFEDSLLFFMKMARENRV